MEYYSAIKRNKVMSFVATWMDPEIVKLSESQVRMRKTNTIWYYMQNLKKKKDKNELVYKTETESQTWNTYLWLLKGKCGPRIKLGVWDWHAHSTIYKTDNQQGLTGHHRELYSISSNILHMGKESKRERMDTCICKTELLWCTPEINTTL